MLEFFGCLRYALWGIPNCIGYFARKTYDSRKSCNSAIGGNIIFLPNIL